MKQIVEITSTAQKKIKKLPKQVVVKLKIWVAQVETVGIHRVMKIKGFHDEPLKGKRQGERSIRLNKAYRAFYRKDVKGNIEIIEIFDVNKHDY